MAALNISTRMSLLKLKRTPDFLPSSKSLRHFLGFQSRPRKKRAQKNHAFTVRSMTIAEERYRGHLNSPNGLAGSPDKYSLYDDQSIEYYSIGQARATPNSRRKTKIVCTIGPSTSTDKDWEDIKFGVDNQVDFYAVSFVKDARVVHELKDYLKSCNADIHVIVKIESADSIPNLHSIIPTSDGAMVACGDLGAELPIEDVPLLKEDIIRRCQRMLKLVIVATNMLESMINHPTPTRAEVSDIAITVREGADAVMLSGETAHGKYPLKVVKVMHTVALRTELSLPISTAPPNLLSTYKSHMGEMFAFHATTMANTLNTPIIVFTRTGSMAVLLSHYRPYSTIFAFTNEERIKQRLVLYHGVLPIYMEFSNDAEETFSRALKLLLDRGHLKEGEDVTLVQSGAQPIWRSESTHHIQVRRVQS